MDFKHIYAIYLRQLMLLWHNFTRFANIFIWITLDIILWGFITKYLNAVGNTALNFTTVLLGAVVLWNFLIRVQQGVMLAFFEDVWSRNFINLFSSPLTVRDYISGIIATSVTTSVAGFFVMVMLSRFFFGYNIFILGLYVLPFLVILFLFGLTLGILALGLVLRFGPSAEWMTWPIPFLLSPLVGVFYPISTLPVFLQPVSQILSPTYAFEGMRSVLVSGTVSAETLALGIALGLIYLLLAYLLFVAVYRSVLRSGLIARFSAETA